MAELQATVRDLLARLGTNASNSGTPPAATPLGAPPPVVKKKSCRPRGGQPGPPPHRKQLLPPERVHNLQPFVPRHCGPWGRALPAQPAPHDPAPPRFQTIDLPPVVATVPDYPGHARTCPPCAAVTRAALPRARLAPSVGPRLTATLSYWAGCHGVSKRGVEEMAAAVFAAPVALGTGANREQERNAAGATPHAAALAAVRPAEVTPAGETGWKLAGTLCWLWAAATPGVAAVVSHARRRALGRAALLGTEIRGILGSDRWPVYNGVPAERRPVCWAHLKRDFQKVVDRDGPSALGGRQGRQLVHKVFAAWQAFREGHSTRAQLQETLAPVMNRLQRLLLPGAILGEDKTVATFCENLRAVAAALGTFVEVEGVEPTHNFLERLRRRAVLGRQRRFGSWSAAGCRFVERIWTVVQTRRLQGQNVLDYLHEALRAYRSGQPCPKLLPEG